MSDPKRQQRSTASAILAVLSFLAGCTNAPLEPLSQSSLQLDDHLSIQGRVCTRVPDPNGFPVKVLLIVDKSGSMCVSDPPGSQGVAGICELVAANEGILVPGRVGALKQLLAQFSGKSNVSVSIVPFETNISGPWPSAGGFGPASAVPAQLISDLQNQLGKGTDYQGALSEAFARLSADIIAGRNSNPALLQRTRYVVVFLTDGTPYPRCTANDPPALGQYADPSHPELTWADSASAGTFCNKGATTGGVNGFNPGSDLNQNYQIFDKIRQIMTLKDAYNVGDIRVHTVLLFNELAVQRCGLICLDLFGDGIPAGTPATAFPGLAKQIARYVLQQIASIGNGVYQEFVNTQVQQLSLGALDYTSLASRNVLKTLMAQSLSSFPGVDKRELDTDGDGLADQLDNPIDQGAYGTSRFNSDSDGDCFSDSEEVNRWAQGFRPKNDPDPRGRPSSAAPGCPDTDGDGLSTYAENFVTTHNGLADTDADGLLDGVEENLGLNPLESNAALDTDGDGIPDVEEVLAGSNPVKKDAKFFDDFGYQYQTQAEVQSNGSICYDYTISNLQLVTPPARAGARQGYNLFRVLFSEAAESGVATDYGVWKTGCGWAQFDPPGIRIPVGPTLDLNNNKFFPLTTFLVPDDYLGSRCVGSSPSTGVR